ncbi:MAG: MtnX-like HAD-IB family phosphatase [Chloroflexi bacterium]|nr:MtnX-like HAD-IB family phosphatase [Chloroflexota bacterium]
MKTTGANSASGRPHPAVLTDFDDTAAAQNVAEMLLYQFGAPDWQDVRQRFRDGEINLKEYQEIAFRDIRADRATMQSYVKDHANLRPFFTELWSFCQANGIPMAVVSQGLDFYIEALLERSGMSRVPIYAVDTEFIAGKISYRYNHAYPGNESQGNSKGFVVESFQERGCYVFFAGDGQSDLEAARVADVTYAHRTLADLCDAESIPFQPFRDFGGMLLAVKRYTEIGSNGTGGAAGREEAGLEEAGRNTEL